MDLEVDPGNLATATYSAEPDPLWAEVVDRVICDGRPGYLRDAADRYEHLLRRMHDEATTIEDELGRLAESWNGAAFAAYHAVVEAVVADMRLAATSARAIVDALRLAADLLRGHQERIPIPARLGSAVFRAHHQRREPGGGVAPSNADFEQAVHADVVANDPLLPAPQALEQAAILFQQQQEVARRVYRELSAAYGAVAELLPPVPVVATPVLAVVVAAEPAETKHGAGHHRAKGDLTIGAIGEDEGEQTDAVVLEVAEIDLVDTVGAGVDDLPVAAALGGNDDTDARLGGKRSGSGTGPPETGAAFGVPVSVMSTPGAHTGMGMGTPGMHTGMGVGTPGLHTGMPTPGMNTPGMSSGMGSGMSTHLGTPMGAGYGGVIGGLEGDPNSSWLTETGDDPLEQDGESSGAVLS